MSDLNKTSPEIGGDFATISEIAVPPECKVVFYNDDYTTMEFVVEVLRTVFNKSEDEANALMMMIHEAGSGVVGSYTYDIAVSKANIAKSMARKNGFPLRVEVE